MEAALGRNSSSPFCVTPRAVIDWDHFAADVMRARSAIYGHGTICNLSKQRYDFMVLLTAAMVNGQTTILPSSRAAGAVAQAMDGLGAVLTLQGLADLPPSGGPFRAEGKSLAAELASASGDVYVFTSGSTNRAVRHRKSWTTLVGGGRLTAEILATADFQPENSLILCTTPHQHMYGLEAAVFTALAFGFSVYDAPLFYPADLEIAAERATDLGIDNLVLATSPQHLKFLGEALTRTPNVRAVISATAPLHLDVAARLETGGRRQVFEIYGCTEVGSLAWRRTTVGELWTPSAGFRLEPTTEGIFADAPHLPTGAILGDEIDLLPDGRFRLIGRRADMVSIAGKRQSLGALSAVLAAIDEIDDGVVLRETVDGEDRLSVLVVARPPADAEVLRKLVRDRFLLHFDPVFAPRRIRLVPRIPRNETGKVLAADLLALGGQSSPGACNQSGPRE